MRLDRGRFENHNGARVVCARYTWIMANKNQNTFINHFSSDESKPETILSIYAAVLSTVIENFESALDDGAFAVLFKSRLIMPMQVELRER